MLFSMEKAYRSKMSADLLVYLLRRRQDRVAMGREMILTYTFKSRRSNPLNRSLAIHLAVKKPGELLR